MLLNEIIEIRVCADIAIETKWLDNTKHMEFYRCVVHRYRKLRYNGICIQRPHSVQSPLPLFGFIYFSLPVYPFTIHLFLSTPISIICFWQRWKLQFLFPLPHAASLKSLQKLDSKHQLCAFNDDKKLVCWSTTLIVIMLFTLINLIAFAMHRNRKYQ